MMVSDGHVMVMCYLFDWLDSQRDDRVRNVNGFLTTKNEEVETVFYQTVSHRPTMVYRGAPSLMNVSPDAHSIPNRAQMSPA